MAPIGKTRAHQLVAVLAEQNERARCGRVYRAKTQHTHTRTREQARTPHAVVVGLAVVAAVVMHTYVKCGDCSSSSTAATAVPQ